MKGRRWIVKGLVYWSVTIGKNEIPQNRFYLPMKLSNVFVNVVLRLKMVVKGFKRYVAQMISLANIWRQVLVCSCIHAGMIVLTISRVLRATVEALQ